jgi:hypothetical protein
MVWKNRKDCGRERRLQEHMNRKKELINWNKIVCIVSKRNKKIGFSPRRYKENSVTSVTSKKIYPFNIIDGRFYLPEVFKIWALANELFNYQ